jgi:hypothetical protein
LGKIGFLTLTGDPDRIRTCDLPLRRRLLYPTELRGQTIGEPALSASIVPIDSA